MRPPRYFECGWWSPWCFIDEWAHRLISGFRDTESGCGELPGPFKGICKRHDEAVVRHYARLT
jgi:hypothetical protein